MPNPNLSPTPNQARAAVVPSVQRRTSTVTGASAATLAVVTGVSRGCTQAPSATSTRSGTITTPTAYRCTTWRRTASVARASPWRCCVLRARRVSLTWQRKFARCYRGSRNWRSSSNAAPLLPLGDPSVTPLAVACERQQHRATVVGVGPPIGCARFHDAWWWNTVCVTCECVMGSVNQMHVAWWPGV